LNVLQRRTLWLCVFGLSYIFWYEARGVALVWQSNGPHAPLQGLEAREYFWNHFSYGAFFLIFGALLTVVLRKKTEPAPYYWADWVALATGLGLLVATGWVSYAGLQ
jgi:hypothetical protein